jgi:hypothetical protein
MQEELEVPAPPDLDEGAEQALGQLEEWREDEAVSWVFDNFNDDDNLFEEESADEDYDGYSSDDSSTGPEASGGSAGRPNQSI